MKLATILAIQAPSLGLALVGVNWRFDRFPELGVSDITFRFNMRTTPVETGYYFAQQFNFANVPEVSNCGLQPREMRDGQEIIHADFVSLQGGTYTTHTNCADGVDGGAGVHCWVEFPGNYNHTYNIRIKKKKHTDWEAMIIDDVTKDEYEIGSWTLPGNAGLIQNGQIGFVEYSPWNSQSSGSCQSLPRTSVTFLKPSAKHFVAKRGRILKVYEYGDCIAEAGFSAREVKKGWTVRLGFANATTEQQDEASES
ncbi:hypothetical protein CDD81_323 [Ophiocordyceps australis]|uniref:Ubiquitin 3 binding protein But2 C-terminal domain-containing protein n=1 Tax=Ophiocordyceps australis TaxID=1399860 RepID=A0A2C5Y1C8_9HYPO|nr:hypothetical protein CDD81_323 [Ophiocordyceps australis]